MAASNPPVRSPDDEPDAGIGMAHPTVVPVNFVPPERKGGDD